MPRALSALVAALAMLVLAATPALAHGGATPGVVTVAQTLGHHELTVTMYPPAGGTGPMPVQVVAQGRVLDGGMLVLMAMPAGGGPTSQTVVAAGTTTPTTVTLRIDRPGDWEVVLLDSPDVARIPLSVPAPPATPAWAWLLRAGLLAAVVGLVGGTAVRRRRPRAALGLGALAAVGTAMAVTAVLLPVGTPDVPMEAPGAVVVTAAVQPPSDGLAELTLDVTDGSTGAPVDDLMVHDDALLHLVVIGPAGRFWHVHPVRTAPGHFSVRLALSDPGRYGVVAELVRAGGGHQVVRSAITLGAGAGAPPTVAEGPGSRTVDGLRVDITTGRLVAGQDAHVELVFSERGRPVRDLQAWLGMAGHLIVVGPGPDPTDPATSYAHVHDMAAAVQHGYGPGVGFDYAFPTAGRYRLWAQVQRDWRLITIPITVDVAPGPSGP